MKYIFIIYSYITYIIYIDYYKLQLNDSSIHISHLHVPSDLLYHFYCNITLIICTLNHQEYSLVPVKEQL